MYVERTTYIVALETDKGRHGCKWYMQLFLQKSNIDIMVFYRILRLTIVQIRLSSYMRVS